MLTPLASLVSDLKDLTPLILGVLFVFLALVFRKRLTALKFQRGDTSMEAALSPNEQTSQTAAEEAGSVSEEPPPEEPSGDLPEDPDAPPVVAADPPVKPEDTNIDALRKRLYEAIEAKDDENSKALFDQLQHREEDPVEQKLDRATWLYLRFTEGMETDALEKLEGLATDSDVTARVLMLKGLGYEFAGNPEAAAVEYARARDAAPDELYAVTLTGRLAGALNATGQYALAVSELENMLRRIEDPGLRGRLWAALADVYEKHDEHELRALALQQALEQSPDARGRRFSTAFAYSEADHKRFAPVVAHHYQTVIRFHPDHVGARNNLAVVFDRKDLDILAVEEYRKASEGGNTLAAANLAYQYLNAGLAGEAEEIVSKAAEDESPHPNVGEATAAITNARSEQTEARSELYADGQRQAAFLSKYAEARIRVPTSQFAGKWRFPDGGVADVSWDGGDLTGTWTVRKTAWKFEGEPYASSARLTIKKMDYAGFGSARTELGFKTHSHAHAYIDEDGQSLELMEVRDNAISFRTLHRVPDND